MGKNEKQPKQKGRKSSVAILCRALEKLPNFNTLNISLKPTPQSSLETILGSPARGLQHLQHLSAGLCVHSAQPAPRRRKERRPMGKPKAAAHGLSPPSGRTTARFPASQSLDFPLPSLFGNSHSSYTRDRIPTPKQTSTGGAPTAGGWASPHSPLQAPAYGRTGGGIKPQPANQGAAWRRGRAPSDITSFANWVAPLPQPHSPVPRKPCC